MPGLVAVSRVHGNNVGSEHCSAIEEQTGEQKNDTDIDQDRPNPLPGEAIRISTRRYPRRIDRAIQPYRSSPAYGVRRDYARHDPRNR